MLCEVAGDTRLYLWMMDEAERKSNIATQRRSIGSMDSSPTGSPSGHRGPSSPTGLRASSVGGTNSRRPGRRGPQIAVSEKIALPGSPFDVRTGPGYRYVDLELNASCCPLLSSPCSPPPPPHLASSPIACPCSSLTWIVRFSMRQGGRAT